MLFILLSLSLITSCHKKVTNKIFEIKDSMKYVDRGFFVGVIENDSLFLNSILSENGHSINPVLYLENELLFQERDSTLFFLTDKKNIKIVNIDDSQSYILLTKIDPVRGDSWLILRVKKKNVVSIYCAIKDIFNDIDKDGYYEVGGRGLTDAVCLDCDSIVYEPYKIYKLAHEFTFDSILSKELTIKLYGTYLGENYIDTALQQKSYIDWNKTTLKLKFPH